MTEKLLATIVIMLCGSLLVLVRRFNNKDRDAGLGVAGWTIAIIFFMWVDIG